MVLDLPKRKTADQKLGTNPGDKRGKRFRVPAQVTKANSNYSANPGIKDTREVNGKGIHCKSWTYVERGKLDKLYIRREQI